MGFPARSTSGLPGKRVLPYLAGMTMTTCPCGTGNDSNAGKVAKGSANKSAAKADATTLETHATFPGPRPNHKILVPRQRPQDCASILRNKTGQDQVLYSALVSSCLIYAQ